MGSWQISVKGHGCHHNNREDIDADLATREFVEKLKKQGHQIKEATFTLTASDDEDMTKPKGG